MGRAKRLTQGPRWLLALHNRLFAAWVLSGVLLGFFLFWHFLFSMIVLVDCSLLRLFLGCIFVILCTLCSLLLAGGGCNRFFIGLGQWFFKCFLTPLLPL